MKDIIDNKDVSSYLNKWYKLKTLFHGDRYFKPIMVRDYYENQAFKFIGILFCIKENNLVFYSVTKINE